LEAGGVTELLLADEVELDDDDEEESSLFLLLFGGGFFFGAFTGDFVGHVWRAYRSY